MFSCLTLYSPAPASLCPSSMFLHERLLINTHRACARWTTHINKHTQWPLSSPAGYEVETVLLLMVQWLAPSPTTDVEVMTKTKEQLSLSVYLLPPLYSKWKGELRTWDELILTMWCVCVCVSVRVWAWLVHWESYFTLSAFCPALVQTGL